MEYSIIRFILNILLCNVIKLVDILHNYAASKQKSFLKINKMILVFVKKIL